MSWKFWKRSRKEEDLSEEFLAHLEIDRNERMEAGASKEEADRQSRAEFGNQALIREVTREMWGWDRIESLLRDFRVAVRLLRRTPAFAILALLTIAVTVGGVSTVYTLVDSVLLEPLPFPDADRLVRITQTDSRFLPFFVDVSEADFVDFRNAASSFTSVAALRRTSDVVRDGAGQPFALDQAWVTPEWFTVFGIRPVEGRPLVSDDSATGIPEAVLGHSFWQSYFGGDPDVVGRTIRFPRFVDGPDIALFVVGIMPADFDTTATAPDVHDPPVWRLLEPEQSAESRENRRLVAVIGRLTDGAGPESAEDELQDITERLAENFPDSHTTRSTRVAPLKSEIVESAGQALWLFMGAVGFVLLIGMVNLTNLQIVRNAVRSPEIRTRVALGAGRGRIVRQLALEAAILSIAGGALGVALGVVGTDILIAVNPSPFPRNGEIALDLSIVLVTLATATLTGLVSGLIPAWQASRPGIAESMREGNRTSTAGRHRAVVQKSLIGVQAAIVLVLLIGAALMSHSYWRLFTEDAGMEEENLWRAILTLPPGYDMEAEVDFRLRALEEIEQLPFVESAGTITGPPLDGSDLTIGGIRPLNVEGDIPDNGFMLSVRSISADYLRTIGVGVVEGRSFSEGDDESSERVGILNESAAALLFPDRTALGERITYFQGTVVLIVGIAPDYKHRRLDIDAAPQLYTPARQAPASLGSGAFMVRVRDDGSAGRIDALETIVTAMEPAASVQIASAAEARWAMFSSERFRSGLLAAFAATALGLAMIGIFGVVSYTVAVRTREVGIRMALGARAGHIMGLMLRQLLWPAAIGLGSGLLAAVGLTRFLESFLFRVTPTDPLTFAGATACLLLTSVAASLVPARRATRVDLPTVLGHE